jgi:hypothetical protein
MTLINCSSEYFDNTKSLIEALGEAVERFSRP